MTLEVTSSPRDADVRALSDGIRHFNHRAVPDLEPETAEVRFFVIARNQAGAVQGGLRATCYWNTLHIELMWVAESGRGQGVGQAVLRRAEAKAAELDCAKAFVETTSWQAKPFYERNGYTHVATLNDRPKGHSSHYLSKSL